VARHLYPAVNLNLPSHLTPFPNDPKFALGFGESHHLYLPPRKEEVPANPKAILSKRSRVRRRRRYRKDRFIPLQRCCLLFVGRIEIRRKDDDDDYELTNPYHLPNSL